MAYRNLKEHFRFSFIHGWGLYYFIFLVTYGLFFLVFSFAHKHKHIADKKAVNKFYFLKHIYPDIKRAECGDCKTLCHYDPKDRGGVTCAGVSITHNPEWFVSAMNSLDKCKKSAQGFQICKEKTLRTKAFERIYKNYAKPFEACSKKAFPLLVDSAVLSGVGTAIKHIQRQGNIKADGKFGPKTLRACTVDFNPDRFTYYRIKRFKILKGCKDHCRGWIKRAKRVLKEAG